MRRKAPDIPGLVEVARLYYESGLTQDRIARSLRRSRPGVQRMIQAARDLGIVTITITDPLGVTEATGRRLREVFGLERAIVVPGVRGDPEATKARVGEAGARYLNQVLKGTETLGVAWGTTVRAVARALPPRRLERLRVVQMVGELGLSTEASETFRAIADRLGGRAIALPAPAMEKSRAIRRTILQSAHIQEVFRILREADIVLTGIGPVSSEATIVKRGHVTAAVMRSLAKHGAAGEMNTKFFDGQGCALAAINSQIIGLELEDLPRIPHVIAVVSDGPGKDTAVLGALRGKYVDTLVIDEVLANRVIARNTGA
jgi:DNA-binding transcriptional regulator LsrR (DeoR family)